MSLLQGAIAANRFGLGARPGEILAASSDPRGWLKAQIRPDAALIPADGLMTVEQVFTERREAYANMSPDDLAKLGGKRKAAADPSMQTSDGSRPEPGGQNPALANIPQEVRKEIQKEARQGLQQEIAARSRHAAATPDPFAERWVRFWSNHFTVAARNPQLIGIVGPFERDVIRAHAFGSFAGLLGASTFHPTMLVYLDANRSIGPSTQVAERRKLGLNENLAREVLELHTMGVDTGYTQADVIEFAKALTGWTVGGQARPGGGQNQQKLARLAGRRRGGGQGGGLIQVALDLQDHPGETVFVEPFHEPGSRKILGKTYSVQGKQQAAAVLDDLARSPATAHHIATKLARHFVADDPPPAAVAKLQAVFLETHGDLSALARTVVDLDEAWVEAPAKFKTPEELLVSVSRAAGAQAAFGRDQRAVYVSLAQQPFGAPSPAGWPDIASAWSGADAVMKRLEWANAVSQRMSAMGSPEDFLDRALGPMAGEKTRQGVSRAESAEQGFTLALMSPEFQRR
ncbi:MAG: DUF1800 family protein [Alphaproteobacteria bacterium]|nr:DUF1800 family protein [Alphaproteobacteria bacterium]